MLSKEVSSTIFETLVWLDLGLNPGLLGHWRPFNSLGQWTLYTGRIDTIRIYKNIICFFFFFSFYNEIYKTVERRRKSGTFTLYTHRGRYGIFVLLSREKRYRGNSEHLLISASSSFFYCETLFHHVWHYISRDSIIFSLFSRDSYISSFSLPLNPELGGTRPAHRAALRLVTVLPAPSLSLILTAFSHESKTFSRYIIFRTPTQFSWSLFLQHATHAIHMAFLSCFIYLKTPT